LTGGAIHITSEHDEATYVTLISFHNNPQSFAQFNTTPSGQTYSYLTPYIQLSKTGKICVPASVSSLGLQGVTDGTNATILVQYNGGDGALYQCADVVLSTDTSIVVPGCTNTSSVSGVSYGVSSTAPAAATQTAKTGNAADMVAGARLGPVLGLASALALLGAIL